MGFEAKAVLRRSSANMPQSGSTTTSSDSTTAADQTVTVVVARMVKPGCEAAFETWIHEVAHVATAFPDRCHNRHRPSGRATFGSRSASVVVNSRQPSAGG